MLASEELYLRPNVVAEPLVDDWYAWSHLIQPANLARNVTERHLKIMENFLASPSQHAEAVKNPKLAGGPFIDVDPARVEEIRQLYNRTRTHRSRQIELSRAIEELDTMLKDHADGYSLEGLYSKIPGPLQGYVELVYDLNSYPSFRIFEPLLYRSEYYDPTLQSLMLSTISGDDRPFVLSTPRLDSDWSLRLRIPFADERLDDFFETKRKPKTFAALKGLLGLPDALDERLRGFLTTSPPEPYRRYEGPGARWRYFGHACILLETGGKSILLDPVLSYTYESAVSRYTYADLPEYIDFVLITHNHQDHILFETLLQIRHRVGAILVPASGGGALQDPSLKLILRQCGFRNVIELTEMEQISAGSVTMTAVPFVGEHGDLSVRTKTAWLVQAGGQSFLFGADSCNLSPSMYRHIHRDLGEVDVLFLGMECDGAPVSWLYGPLFTEPLERSMDHSRRLAGSNFERAIGIVDEFRCREVYVYAMGQEPWLNYVMSIKYTEVSNPIVQSNRLLKACAERGIVAERLFGEKEILVGTDRNRSAVPQTA